MGMNTKLVKPEDAPRSYADLLDPKWRGRLVKGHPSYSGSIVTTTFLVAKHLGWSYLEQAKLWRSRGCVVEAAE